MAQKRRTPLHALVILPPKLSATPLCPLFLFPDRFVSLPPSQCDSAVLPPAGRDQLLRIKEAQTPKRSFCTILYFHSAL